MTELMPKSVPSATLNANTLAGPSARSARHVRSPAKGPPGRLALADGSIFHGEAFGAIGRAVASQAEVVFSTGMSGYQESLTDPSYTGQILVQTFPLIGNTGVNAEDVESRKVQVAGLVVRELARRYSNYRATDSLDSYLEHHGVLGLAGIDTRALTKRLRSRGAMPGVLTDRPQSGHDAITDSDLVNLAASAPSMSGQNLVPNVGCSTASTWTQTLGDWAHAGPTPSQNHPFRVLALDCGAKANILRNLTERGCEVRVVPHTTTAEEILRLHKSTQIDGLFVSNGPGDPAAVDQTIETLRRVIGDPQQVPVFGICLGHQLLALAAGAKTYKLKFGHRGTNQPVLNIASRRVEITSQNHGFAVETASIEAVGGIATHTHLNDHTLAGFRFPDRPVFAVQYHPEASPGPHDASYLFDEFVEAMAARRRR